MRWSDISVLGKLLVGFGTVITGVLVIVGLNFVLSSDVREDLKGLARVSVYEQSLLKAEIAHHTWTAAVSDYILSDGKKDPRVAENGRECSFGKWFYGPDRINMEKAFPELAGSLSAVDAPHTNLHASLQGIRKAIKDGNPNEAQRIFEEESQVGLNGVRINLGKALEVLDKYSIEYTNSLSTKAQNNIRFSLIAGFILLVACIFFALVLGRSISGPLKRLVGYAREVAGGNLRQPRIHQKDEVGMLSDALGIMVQTLKDKIEEAHNQTESAKNKEAEAGEARLRAETAMRTVASKHSSIVDAVQGIERVVSAATEASGRLSVQINQSERGASVQSKRISQIVTSMDDMNSTVLEVSRSAGSAEQYSTNARSKAEDGANVVQQAVRSIQLVQEQSVSLRDGMQTLDEHARAISRIMAVISDIADQTNLLALNAAIEAARAGEAGRGFAVVADEVRKLAEKTMASTTDVAAAISAIQKSAENSMHQMDNAVEQIEQATGLANKSGEALREIVSMVDHTADQVRAIAQASGRQSSCSDAITQAIDEVNTVSSETASAMRDAARAVNDLTGQTSVLNTLMDQMRKED